MLILKWIVCLSLAFGACGVRADVDPGTLTTPLVRLIVMA